MEMVEVGVLFAHLANLAYSYFSCVPPPSQCCWQSQRPWSYNKSTDNLPAHLQSNLSPHAHTLKIRLFVCSSWWSSRSVQLVWRDKRAPWLDGSDPDDEDVFHGNSDKFISLPSLPIGPMFFLATFDYFQNCKSSGLWVKTPSVFSSEGITDIPSAIWLLDFSSICRPRRHLDNSCPYLTRERD